jgi:tRNA modification GTPase
LAGGLSGPLHGLRERLLDLLADLEAGLDFAEEHIEFVTVDEAISRLTAATAELDSLLNSLTARSLVTEWPHVVLVGCPNTGKSSLFNALVGSEPAIVSCVSGTTRDYLQAPLRLESLTCMLVDSAGVEANAPHDSISALAQEMTAIQSGQAVLRLLCVDATRELNDWERTQLRDCGKLVVLTKCDCPELISTSITGIKTSARFGRGLDELKARIAARLLSISGDAVPATAERCRASLVQTAIGLKNAIQLAQDRAGDELVASEIRFALEELGKVTGVTYTEDVLDRIFSRFCIGK